MSYYCVVRGVFLTFAFPYIIDYGRKWWDDGSSPPAAASPPPGAKPLSQRSRRVSAAEDVEAAVTLGLEDTGDAPAAALTLPADEKNSAFDLFFLKWSLVADGCLTGLATFCSQSWEVFVVATLLPLASGSASAAKSVMIEMCPASQKADALSAISLVEMVAALSTREFCECVGSARGGGGEDVAFADFLYSERVRGRVLRAGGGGQAELGVRVQCCRCGVRRHHADRLPLPAGGEQEGYRS